MSSSNTEQFTVPELPKVKVPPKPRTTVVRTGALTKVSNIKQFFQPSLSDIWSKDRQTSKDSPVLLRHTRLPSTFSTSTGDIPSLLQRDLEQDHLNQRELLFNSSSQTTDSIFNTRSTPSSPTYNKNMRKTGKGKPFAGKQQQTPSATYSPTIAGVIDSFLHVPAVNTQVAIQPLLRLKSTPSTPTTTPCLTTDSIPLPPTQEESSTHPHTRRSLDHSLQHPLSSTNTDLPPSPSPISETPTTTADTHTMNSPGGYIDDDLNPSLTPSSQSANLSLTTHHISPDTPPRPTPIFTENMDSSTPSNKRSRPISDSPSKEGQKPSKCQVTEASPSDNSYSSAAGEDSNITSVNNELPATSATPLLPLTPSDDQLQQLQQLISTQLQLHTPTIVQLTLNRLQDQLKPIMEAVHKLTGDNKALIKTVSTEVASTLSGLSDQLKTMDQQIGTLTTNSDLQQIQTDVYNTMEKVESQMDKMEGLEGLEARLGVVEREMDSFQRRIQTQESNHLTFTREIEEQFHQIRLNGVNHHQHTMDVDGATGPGSTHGIPTKTTTGADSPAEPTIRSFILKGVLKLREHISFNNPALLRADPAVIVEKLLRHHDINSHGALCRLSVLDIKGKGSRLEANIMLVEMTSLLQKRGATIRIREFLRKSGLLPGVQISDCYQQSEQPRARALTRYAAYLKEQGTVDAYRINNRAGTAVLQTYKGMQDWHTHTDITEDNLRPYYLSKLEREKNDPAPLMGQQQPIQHRQQQQREIEQQRLQDFPPLPLQQRPPSARGAGATARGGATPKKSSASNNNKVIIRGTTTPTNSTTAPKELTRKESSELIRNALRRKELAQQMAELDARDKALGLQPHGAGATAHDTTSRNGILDPYDPDHPNNNP